MGRVSHGIEERQELSFVYGWKPGLRFRQSMKIVEATFNTLAAAIASANGRLTKAYTTVSARRLPTRRYRGARIADDDGDVVAMALRKTYRQSEQRSYHRGPTDKLRGRLPSSSS